MNLTTHQRKASCTYQRCSTKPSTTPSRTLSRPCTRSAGCPGGTIGGPRTRSGPTHWVGRCSLRPDLGGPWLPQISSTSRGHGTSPTSTPTSSVSGCPVSPSLKTPSTGVTTVAIPPSTHSAPKVAIDRSASHASTTTTPHAATAMKTTGTSRPSRMVIGKSASPAFRGTKPVTAAMSWSATPATSRTAIATCADRASTTTTGVSPATTTTARSTTIIARTAASRRSRSSPCGSRTARSRRTSGSPSRCRRASPARGSIRSETWSTPMSAL